MIAQTMRAAVVRDFGQPLRIEDVPVHRPGRNQILVKVVASGVCHTDLHAIDGDWPVKPKMPLIPGHEAVGYVAAVGEGVNTVKEGDAVGVPWAFRGCTVLVEAASIASRAGRHFARVSKTVDTVWMEDLRSMLLLMRDM